MLKITGLKKFQDNIKKLQGNLKAFEGNHRVPLPEVMPPDFIAKCTHGKFASVEELFSASGFKIETKEDFAAVPDDDWDAFIRVNTSYDNWEEMQKDAAGEYAKELLMKGLK